MLAPPIGVEGARSESLDDRPVPRKGPAKWLAPISGALRLARYFGTSERFWLGLQTDHDLEEARLALEGRIECEVRPRVSEGAQSVIDELVEAVLGAASKTFRPPNVLRPGA